MKRASTKCETTLVMSPRGLRLWDERNRLASVQSLSPIAVAPLGQEESAETHQQPVGYCIPSTHPLLVAFPMKKSQQTMMVQR